MRKLILLMHTSLDGYVATSAGSMDFIAFTHELFEDVGKLTLEADTAIYGRKTYEMMEGYWPTAGDQPNASRHDKDHSEWYKKVNKYVISKGRPKTGDKAEVIGKNLLAEINSIKSQPGKNILMIGSPGSAQAVIKEGLIDEFRLFVYPSILGTGISFYPNEENRIQLNLVDSKTYSTGAVALTYALKK